MNVPGISLAVSVCVHVLKFAHTHGPVSDKMEDLGNKKWKHKLV